MALFGLALVTGISVSARSEDATKIGGKSASDWVAVLRSGDPKARSDAFVALMLFDLAARGAVPALIDALDDPRQQVQIKAADALRYNGPDAAAATPALARKLRIRGSEIGIAISARDALVAIGPAAVPALIQCVEGDNKDARDWAMVMLAGFGPAAKDAVPALAQLVNLQDDGQARIAVTALGRIGPGASAAIPALSAAYESLRPDDEDRKVELLDALPKIGAPPSPRIIKDLDDPNPARRADAVMILSRFGARAHSAAGRVEALVGDPSPVVRVKAAVALLRVEPANPRALPALSNALDSSDIDVLDDAVTAIAELGSKGAIVAPKLKRIVARMDLTSGTQIGNVFATKAGAAEALVAVAPGSGEGVAALIALLNDGGDSAGPAVRVLGRLGPRASAAIPALVAVAGDPKSAVRFEAVQALTSIDGGRQEILPALIKFVSVEPAPTDTEATKSRLSEEKREVIVTISRMGARALPAVQCLIRVLTARSDEDRDSWESGEKLAAVRALGRIGPAARDAVPFMVEVMRTELHPSLREQRRRASAGGRLGSTGADWSQAVPALVEALGAMGAAATPALPDLVDMLGSEWYLASLATQVLGSIGPRAQAAVPALIERLNDKKPYVAARAGVALLRIDPFKRDLVEARLRSIPVTNDLYDRAILAGARGWRTPEADGFARRFLKMIDSHLQNLVALTAEDPLRAREEGLDDIEDIMARLSSLGAGAEGAIGRLTELTHHSEPEVRRLASETLKRISPIEFHRARRAILMKAIFPALLLMVHCFHSASADEPRMFCGKTVEGWREILRNNTGAAVGRTQAVWALACFGPEAKAAVPDLFEALHHGQFQNEAVEALVQIGSGAEVTVPILIERFKKRGCSHRTGMGTFLVDDSMEESLVRIGGPAVPSLVEVLISPDREMRVCAAAVLGRIGTAARAAVPALVGAIENSDTDRLAVILKGHAIRALGRIGPEARAAVPVLNRLLDEALKHVPREGRLVASEGRRVALDIATALDRIGAPPVRKLLDAFLRTGDSLAAYQLAWLGPGAREATPSLWSALSDERLQVRVAAAVALAHIEPAATGSIPVLIEGLNHLDEAPWVVRREIPRALVRLGPKARPAIPALMGLVEQKCDIPEVYIALVQIDPEGKQCVPALMSALDHEDFHVGDVAANCLGLLGRQAKEAVPVLAAAMTRDFAEQFSNGYDPQVSAAKALRRIGPQAKSAIPALIGAMKYRRRLDIRGEVHDFSVAVTAAEVLGSFRAEAKTAIPALIEVVQTREKDDASWELRQAAICALGRMGPDAKTAIAVLRNLINDDRTPFDYLPETMAALYQLASDGKELAERWLERLPGDWVSGSGRLSARHIPDVVGDRALVLGVMGRTSAEADCLTRNDLERLDRIFTEADRRDWDPPMHIGECFENLGRLGVGGRLAIPRLNELRRHTNPWVRMWATESLQRIAPEEIR